MTDVPFYKHVYQVFFKDETTEKTSMKVMAYDISDAKAIVKRQRSQAVITNVKKIAK